MHGVGFGEPHICVELLRQRGIEIVAGELGLRVVDHADRALQARVSKTRAQLRRAPFPQVHQESVDAAVAAEPLVAVAVGGYPFVGTPDRVAEELANISRAGVRGVAVSFVNYLKELPYFCDEVLPRLARMGLRA